MSERVIRTGMRAGKQALLRLELGQWTRSVLPYPPNVILVAEVGSTAHGTGLSGGEDHDETVEYPRTVQGELADALKDWQEELMPELDASVWSDYINAGFSSVDWYEIADGMLSEGES